MPRPQEADPLTALRDMAEDIALSEAQIEEAVADAVVETYRRLVDEEAEVRASVDLAHGTWQLYRVEEGMEVPASVDVPEFPRQAAAAVRAAVAGRVEEAWRRRVLEAAAARHGQLADAIPQRPAGESWYVAAVGDIDPQGACIGPRGVRQRAVTSELADEQVQIVAWSPDPAIYVGNALIPARVDGVALDEAARTAHVTVPAEQLSLAIGRAGENARLAARLTGWRIDIAAPASTA